MTANKCFNETELNSKCQTSNVYKNPDAVTQIAASDTHPLNFTNREPCTWLAVAVS